MATERLYPANEAALGRDLGADRETRERSCCERVDGTWCVLPSGHRGDHLPANRKAVEP